jgi:hypothetical protein
LGFITFSTNLPDRFFSVKAGAITRLSNMALHHFAPNNCFSPFPREVEVRNHSVALPKGGGSISILRQRRMNLLHAQSSLLHLFHALISMPTHAILIILVLESVG